MTQAGRAPTLLDRDEVRAAIHFGSPPRPPQCLAHWYQEETVQRHGAALDELKRDYPDDVSWVWMGVPMWEAPADDATYRWAFGDRSEPVGASHEEAAVIREWSELPGFLAEFPNAYYDPPLEAVRAARRDRPDGYILACWHLYLNGLLTYLRGMGNLSLDFYDAQPELRAVMDRALEFYRVRARLTAEAGGDGVWGGEDVAGQRALLMRPELFRELYGPYYRELGRIVHAAGLDYWWHSDGDLSEVMDDLVDFGVDVVHPMQAGCMDDRLVAARYGGKIAFWAGMDVQNVIPNGQPEQVRAHVRERIRALGRPEGGLIVGAGNTIGPDASLENLRAYLEALREPAT